MRKFGVIFLAFLIAGCTTAAEPDRRALIAHSLVSTVQLSTEREDGGRRAGSAIVMALDATRQKSVLLTSAHLLEPSVAQEVFVKSPSTGEQIPANILVVDAEADLAVLEAADLGVAPVRFRTEAQLGDNVWVVGFPWGRQQTLVNGAVSQVSLAPEPGPVQLGGPVSLIDAPVSYGASGGGVFEGGTGRLLGIVRGYRTVKVTLPGADAGSVTLPVAGETTVIPTTEILQFLDRAKLASLVPAGEVAQTPCCAEY